MLGANRITEFVIDIVGGVRWAESNPQLVSRNGRRIDEPRPGARRRITDVVVEQLITDRLKATARQATHSSTRSVCQVCGLRVSGEFPASPVELQHAFKIDGEQIVSLEIR